MLIPVTNIVVLKDVDTFRGNPGNLWDLKVVHFDTHANPQGLKGMSQWIWSGRDEKDIILLPYV